MTETKRSKISDELETLRLHLRQGLSVSQNASRAKIKRRYLRERFEMRTKSFVFQVGACGEILEKGKD
jgi:AraC-like DNA-binding protein